MAASKNQSAQAEPVINNLGDVTESKNLAPASPVGEIQPLSDLPKGYESVAKQYPTAIGFTLEGSSVALHF